MKFWKKLKYWQIGAIIGFVLGFFPFLGLIFDKIWYIYYFVTTMPRYLGNLLIDCWLCNELLFTIVALNVIQFALIGAGIGFILRKLKERS